MGTGGILSPLDVMISSGGERELVMRGREEDEAGRRKGGGGGGIQLKEMHTQEPMI